MKQALLESNYGTNIMQTPRAKDVGEYVQEKHLIDESSRQ